MTNLVLTPRQAAVMEQLEKKLEAAKRKNSDLLHSLPADLRAAHEQEQVDENHLKQMVSDEHDGQLAQRVAAWLKLNIE